MRIETWFFLGLAGVAATTATFGAASDFPPLNEKVGWLKTERLRGTLFHNPTVQPMFKRFLVRPEVAPRKPAEPIEAVGETYVVLLPDDGVVAAVVEGIRGVEAFPETIYALFDEAGRELSTGKVSPGKSAPIRVAGQQGPCTLLVNSGPALRNLARIRPQTQFWAVDVRSHAAYDRTPLHYHFLRDLKLGGFNLALIDFERLEDAFETEEGLASWAEKVKGWADYARQVGLRIMPTVNLGGSPAEVRAWGDSRPGLYIEPKENLPLAPCPLDRHYWERLYLRRGRVVARLSLENPYVVGYGLDPEMYQCWSYGHYMLSGTCFCDYCLGGFLKAKNLSLDPLTQKQTGKERYEWLRREGLYQDYDQYLEDQMADLARWCREELQAINPNLLLNMFVIEIGNWFCRGVARGFGREGVPVVNFCEHTYYGVGYDPQWLDRITTDFRNWGAYVLQGSAVWDLFFPATEPRFIAAHCYNLATKAQGYFYWPGDNLYRDWGCRHAFFNRPAYWDEYWSALVWTNQEIDRTLAEPGRESPLDAWEPVPWKGKRNRETGGWNTAEAVARIHREKAYPLILAAPTTLYVRIPEPAGMLTVAARTRGKGSAAQLTLLGPEGRKAASGTVTSKEETTLEVKDASPGLWQILIEPSPQGHFTEVGLALRAGGPYLATSPEVLPLAPTKPRGLIGYWSLDEGQGTLVHDTSTPPPFDGTMRGAQWVKGIRGRALKFDGQSGSVEIPLNAPFHRLKEFTLSAWVRLDALPTQGNGASIINKGPEAPVQHVWWWIGYPPAHALILEMGNEKHRWGTSFATGPLQWELGRWYHLAVTFQREGDTCTVRHYRDGELVGESTKTDDLHSGEYDLRIGSYGGLHWINGAIDEVKFFNLARSAEAIREEARQREQ